MAAGLATDSIETLQARYGPGYRWIVTLTGMTAAMTMILSSTMVNVAVPTIMGTFGVGQSDAQWMSTAFLAAMTASQLLGAWVISVAGPRGGYIAAVSLFIIGSLLGAWAPNMDILILARVLQGVGAGIVQPIAMVTIFRVFPARKRGLAMSIYGMGIMLAPIMGPVVGGITIDASSWRFLFFIPLPIAGLAVLLGTLFMPVREKDTVRLPFDWVGYGLVVGAIFCMMTAIANGQREGWASLYIVLLGSAGIGLSVAFVLSQLRATAPILDFSVFRHRQFAAAAVLGFVFGAGNFASTYIIPVFVQTVQNFTPTDSGLVTLPAGLVVMAFFPIAGRMVDAFPAHYLAMVGLLLFALGAALVVALGFNLRGRMFLGDSGSYSLSFIIALLTLYVYDIAFAALPADLIAVWFLIPVVDCLRVMSARAARGHSPFASDRGHLHHILYRRLPWRWGLLVYLGLAGVPGLLASFAPHTTLAWGLASLCCYGVIIAWPQSRTRTAGDATK